MKPNCLIVRPPRPAEQPGDDPTGRLAHCEEEIRDWLRGVPAEVLDHLVRRLLEDVEVISDHPVQ